MTENLQTTELKTLDRWLESTYKSELASITGFNPEAPDVNAARAKLAMEACRRLKLVDEKGSPIPEALAVINKYLPDFQALAE